MADNYLEKRMEDYRRGHTAVRSSTRRGLVFPSVTVFVHRADVPGGDIMLRTLVDAGYKVCFDTTAASAGTSLAQSTGARFYPLAPDAIAEDLLHRGERLVAVVMLGDDCRGAYSCMSSAKWISVDIDGDTFGAIAVNGQTPVAAAIIVAALAHPEVTV